MRALIEMGFKRLNNLFSIGLFEVGKFRKVFNEVMVIQGKGCQQILNIVTIDPSAQSWVGARHLVEMVTLGLQARVEVRLGIAHQVDDSIHMTRFHRHFSFLKKSDCIDSLVMREMERYS